MAIKSIYPTNILVKQIDISEEKISAIENFLKAQHLSFISDSNKNDLVEYRDGNENIIIDAKNSGECPEMEELEAKIKQAYIELAYSNIEEFTESNTEKLMLDTKIDSCKINLMKQGYRLGVHTHYSDDAYACFYFNDVKENEGGELVLYDPRWQRNYWFGGSKLETIRPKRGMLVIAPSFLWHEVSLYTGQEERLTLVVNAQVVNENDIVRNSRTKHTK